MRLTASSLVMVALGVALAAACGSSDSDDETAGNATAGKGGTSTGAGGDSPGSSGTSGSASGGDAPSSGGDGPGSGGASPGSGGETSAGGGSDSEGGGDGEGGSGGAGFPFCAAPDLSGEYDIVSADGDCETLNVDAPQVIEPTSEACVMDMVSEDAEESQLAVNGEITVELDGSFEEARLFLDDVLRFPCNGTWDAEDELLEVVCEGAVQDCTLTLERL